MDAISTERLESLQNALKETFDVYRRTHMAHFNVRGPWFPQLHTLFEEQYREIWAAADDVAERIRALGATVDGNALGGGHVSEGVDAEESVRALAQLNRKLSKTWQDLATNFAEVGDTATEDLAIERIRAHDQHAWMLEAILEGGR